MTGPWPTVYGAAQTTCIVIWANGTKTNNNSNYTVHTRYKSKDSYKVLWTTFYHYNLVQNNISCLCSTILHYDTMAHYRSYRGCYGLLWLKIKVCWCQPDDKWPPWLPILSQQNKITTTIVAPIWRHNQLLTGWWKWEGQDEWVTYYMKEWGVENSDLPCWSLRAVEATAHSNQSTEHWALSTEGLLYSMHQQVCYLLLGLWVVCDSDTTDDKVSISNDEQWHNSWDLLRPHRHPAKRHSYLNRTSLSHSNKLQLSPVLADRG